MYQYKEPSLDQPEAKVVATDYLGNDIYENELTIIMSNGDYVMPGDLKSYVEDMEYKEFLKLIGAEEEIIHEGNFNA